jgi:hypothetical protein
MAVFASADDMYAHFGPYLNELMTDPVIGPKFAASKTSFRVNYSDPDAVMVLDATRDPAAVIIGEEAAAFSPEVELFMSADDGHKFWLGDLNIPIALARRKVTINGSIAKLLGMLPAITPAFGKYRVYCREHPVASGV